MNFKVSNKELENVVCFLNFGLVTFNFSKYIFILISDFLKNFIIYKINDFFILKLVHKTITTKLIKQELFLLLN